MEEFVKEEVGNPKAFLMCWDFEQQAIILRRRGGSPIKLMPKDTEGQAKYSDELKAKAVDFISLALSEMEYGTAEDSKTKIDSNIAERIVKLTDVVKVVEVEK